MFPTWIKRLAGYPTDLKPLPNFPAVTVDQLPLASIILYYGGTKITELVGNWVYKYPYTPPAFHAALYIGNDEIVNVGAETVDKFLSSTFISTRRIDAIIVRGLSDQQRQWVCEDSQKKVGHNTYDWKGFLHFGAKARVLRWMGAIKPDKNNDFCSDDVARSYADIGVPVSAVSHDNTAPWMLQQYAEAHTNEAAYYFEQRTLWIGKDYLTP